MYISAAFVRGKKVSYWTLSALSAGQQQTLYQGPAPPPPQHTHMGTGVGGGAWQAATLKRCIISQRAILYWMRYNNSAVKWATGWEKLSYVSLGYSDALLRKKDTPPKKTTTKKECLKPNEQYFCTQAPDWLRRTRHHSSCSWSSWSASRLLALGGTRFYRIVSANISDQLMLQ